jgi:hypothetical protein
VIGLPIASLPFGSSPSFRLKINHNASLDCSCIGYDLPELLDLKSELRQSSVHEIFIEPMSDIDDPHRGCPWGSGKVERPYYGSQLFVNKFGRYTGSSRVPSSQ